MSVALFIMSLRGKHILRKKSISVLAADPGIWGTSQKIRCQISRYMINIFPNFTGKYCKKLLEYVEGK